MIIDIKGLEKVEKRLNDINKLKDTKPLLTLIGNSVKNRISQAFQDEKSPSGEKWKPNSIRTIHASYKNRSHSKKGKPLRGFLKHASSKKILHNSGHLANSFEYRVDGDKVVIGTNKEYAAIHQFGGLAGRGKRVKIPARPFLPIAGDRLEEGTRREILEIIHNYIAKRLG